jgi:Ca2+-binding RTX toxin-like protein
LNDAQVVGGAATASNVSVVHLEGGAGNDTLRFDEANGPMPKGEFLGGDGRDAFKGGSAADTRIGGAGIDRGDRRTR